MSNDKGVSLPPLLLKRWKSPRYTGDTRKLLDEVAELIYEEGTPGLVSAIGATLSPAERSLLVSSVSASYEDPYFVTQTIMRLIYPMIERCVDSELKSDKEQEMQAFRYIPYDRREFVKAMQSICDVAGFDTPRSFMDVGCGIGDKMLLAALFGNFDKCYGIEINQHTIELGRWHLAGLSGACYAQRKQGGRWPHNVLWSETDHDYRLGDVRDHPEDYDIERSAIPSNAFTFIQGDALEHNFGLYDFIYSYRPIDGYNKIKDLWDHIIQTMPDGGWYLEVYGYDEYFDKYAENIDDNDERYYHEWHIIHKVNGVPRLVDSAIVEKYGELKYL